MQLSGPMDSSLQTRFALEQAKLKPLNRMGQNHENKEELMKTARQFEGIFINQLLTEMDKTVERSDMFSGGPGEDTFRGMLYEKIAESISTRPGGSGFGMAEAVYRQLEGMVPKKSAQETNE